MIDFGTACSGVESASLAWEPLGFKAQWFSEIEPFPAAVLAHRWPDVPNLGDMMMLRHYIELGDVPAPAVFCAGTPCQAYSLAGLRGGLSDPRGALTLEFVRITDAIDKARTAAGEPAGVHVWENVPGVLSSKDNAFGCLLAGLAGEDDEPHPSGKRWPDAGCVFGPRRTVAWRVLDAQFFGVAQRRRRVFLVASSRDRFDPLAVLFEPEGVRRDTAPIRDQWDQATGNPGNSTTGSNRKWPADVSGTLDAHFGTKAGIDNQHIKQGAPLFVPCFWNGEQVTQTLDAVLYKAQTMPEKNRFPAIIMPEVATTMTSGSNSQSAKGAVSGRFFDENLIGCFTPWDTQRSRVHSINGVSPPLDSPDNRGGGAPTVAVYGFQPRIARNGRGDMGDVCHALSAQAGETGKGDAAPCVSVGVKVRRLMPLECERLQGFPDNHVRIPWRGKPAEECPDGPQYKAIGNSKAVPVVQWIGIRIKREIEYGDVGL